MKLKVLLPTEMLIEQEVTKVIAEAENGYFCILPRHVDFVAALVPGIFSFFTNKDDEEFIALDEGILIKCGPEVLVSARNAVRGPDLGQLQQTVEKEFLVVEDREKMARSALAKLEANFVRRFMELEKHGR